MPPAVPVRLDQRLPVILPLAPWTLDKCQQPTAENGPMAVWLVQSALRISLLLVLALLLFLAAIPSFNSKPLPSSYRNFAVTTLKNLVCAQQRFRESLAIDMDGDGRGEAGWFQELAGAVPLRHTPNVTDLDQTSGRISMPLLSPAFAVPDRNIVRRGGNCFRLLLPAAGGGFTDVPTAPVDTDRAELGVILQAWPDQGPAIDHLHVADPAGVIWCLDEPSITWRGLDNAPPSDLGSDLIPRDQGDTSIDGAGRIWRRVQ